MLDEPHLLSGWLSINSESYDLSGDRIHWRENPLELLADTYYFLDMDYVAGLPAAEMIWDHDRDLLQAGTDFYAELNNRVAVEDWVELQALLQQEQAPAGFDDNLWAVVRSAHVGFQSGLDVMAVLPFVAEQTGYFELAVNPDLTINIPQRLDDVGLQERMAKVLVPPPTASSDEILAQSGGMFYSRETPEHESYVQKGAHFEAGDPLYIVEVMKMFNKVYAPFSGTVEEVLVDTDGVIIAKGQPLFKICPDEVVVVESPDEIRTRRRKQTEEFIGRMT